MREQGTRHRVENMRGTLRIWAKRSLITGLALVITCGAIVPFLEGHSLHRFWDSGRYLIFLAEALLVAFMGCLGSTWAAWKVLREIPEEADDEPELFVNRD